MLTWKEWEKLVKKSQKGDDSSLRILLEESQPIIDRMIKQTLTVDDDTDLNDIRQEINSKVLKNLATLKRPRTYVRWLNQITKNFCLDTAEKNRKILFLRIEDLKQRDQDNKTENIDNLADRKGFTADAFNVYQEHLTQLTEKEYLNKAEHKALEIKKDIDSLITRKAPVITENKTISVLSNILGKSFLDKEEYNYIDAEKKLQAIIKYTEKKRLNTELRYIQASAITELAHLKMNEGFVQGNDGSLYWYKRAARLWRSLKDKPKELYTRQQIGVSQHIQGVDKVAIKIYNSILEEISRKKSFNYLKANVHCDQSNALLSIGAIRKSVHYLDKSLLLAEDIGGTTLHYSRLQKAKVNIERRQFDKAYSIISECIDDRPLYRVLDHVKANIALFDVLIKTNEKNAALKLVPIIQANCIDHLFHHQLQKIQVRLSKM